MADEELAEWAGRVFADEWVRAIIPVLPSLPAGSRSRTDERRAFLRAVGRLQAHHTISFRQVLHALGNRIARAEPDQQEPLCEIFTYFMQGYPNPQAYAGFDFYRFIHRRSAG